MAPFVEQRSTKTVTNADLPNNHRAEDARVAMSSSMLDEKAFSMSVSWPDGRPKGPGDCMYLTMTSLFLTVQDAGIVIRGCTILSICDL